MFKQISKLILFLSLVLAFCSSVVFASSDLSQPLKDKLQTGIILHIGNSKAYVNNIQKAVDSTNNSVCPLIIDERTLVPVRFISENLGAKVDWEDATSSVVITYNGSTIKLSIGSNIMFINGIQKQIDVPARILNDRTFIPLRALVESLNKKIFWDDRGIIIISDKDNILDGNTDKELVDEIESKFAGVEKVITVPDNKGSYIFNIPENWDVTICKPESDSTMEIKVNPNNSKCEVILGVIWNPEDNLPISLERLRMVAQTQGTKLLEDAVEKELSLNYIEGTDTKGYSFILTDKNAQPGEFLYLTQYDFAIDGICVLAIMFSTEKYSAEAVQIENMMKNIRKYEIPNINLGSSAKSIAYDKTNDKAYIADNNKQINVINLKTKQIIKKIKLSSIPSDICLSDDNKYMYIASEGSTNITEYDLATGTKVKDIYWEAPIYRSQTDPYHYHIYIKNDYLYLVDAAWAPGLWRINLKDSNPKAESYSTTVGNMGDLTFSQDGTTIYYWHQYGWDAGWAGSDIYKYGVDDNKFTQLDKANKSYPEIVRDPLDAPIILNEDKKWVFCKKLLLSSENLKQVYNTFNEEIYAVNETGTYAVSKKNLYGLENFDVLKKLPDQIKNIDCLFFDKYDILYIIDNTEKKLYYFNINDLKN